MCHVYAARRHSVSLPFGTFRAFHIAASPLQLSAASFGASGQGNRPSRLSAGAEARATGVGSGGEFGSVSGDGGARWQSLPPSPSLFLSICFSGSAKSPGQKNAPRRSVARAARGGAARGPSGWRPERKGPVSTQPFMLQMEAGEGRARGTLFTVPSLRPSNHPRSPRTSLRTYRLQPSWCSTRWSRCSPAGRSW